MTLYDYMCVSLPMTTRGNILLSLRWESKFILVFIHKYQIFIIYGYRYGTVRYRYRTVRHSTVPYIGRGTLRYDAVPFIPHNRNVQTVRAPPFLISRLHMCNDESLRHITKNHNRFCNIRRYVYMRRITQCHK